MPEWVRHEEVTRWCSVLRRDHGAILTRCRGSLDECEPHTITERPAVADRCVACQRAFAAAELEVLAAAGDPHAAAELITTAEDRAVKAAVAALRDRDARRRDYIEGTDYVPGEYW